MKRLILVLAILLMATPAMAESVWVHGGGKSRMLDIQRGPGDQIQIWDFTNGGLVTGQRSGNSNYFLDYRTGKGKWIDGRGLTLDQATDLYIQQDD